MAAAYEYCSGMLGHEVLIISNVKGRVLARTEYLNKPPTWLVGYWDNSNHWQETWLPDEEIDWSGGK